MPRLDITPRLMPAPVAAAYLGVSASKLRTLPIPRRKLDGKTLWDRFDLDAYANDLPYIEPAAPAGESTCADRAFGVVR